MQKHSESEILNKKSNAAQTNSTNENQSTGLKPPALNILASEAKNLEEEENTLEKKETRANQTADDDDTTASPPPNSGAGNTSNNKSVTPFQLKPGKSNLPKDLRGKMENAFQMDLSNITIKENSKKAEDMQANAFSQGDEIHFAPGKFEPFSLKGQELIGHEFAHVKQKQEGKVAPTTKTKGEPVNDNKGLEKEAKEKGVKAAKGEIVENPTTIKTKSSAPNNIIQKDDNGMSSSMEQESYIGRHTNERAFVKAPGGIRLHTTPSPFDPDYIEKTGKAAQIHPPGTKVKLVAIGSTKTASGWSRIEIGNYAGWIESRYLETVPLNPVIDSFTKEFYYVKKGDNLEFIINNAYKGYNYKTGNDRRTIAEAFYHLNRTNPGISFSKDDAGISDSIKDGLDPFFAEARKIYRTIQLSENTIVRLPSVDYINFLRDNGAVGKRPDWMNSSIEIGRGVQGFLEGVIVGFVEAGADAVTGLWDMVKKLFTGELLQQAYDFYKKIEKEGVQVIWQMVVGLFNGAKKDFIDAWNNPNPRQKWKFFGKIIGMVLFEVVLAYFTAGAATAIKNSPKAARIMNKFPGLKRVVGSGDKVVDAVGGRKKASSIAETVSKKRGSKIAKEMGLPDAPSGHHWRRKPDGSLEVRNNPGNQGPRKDYDKKSGTFKDKPDAQLKKANKGKTTHFDELSDTQRQRLDNLKKDRDSARTQRDKHEKGTDEYNKANHQVIQQSHQLGEEAAEMYMKSLGGKRVHPTGKVGGTPKSGEFDQIWEVDGKLYIVEAKGGSSGLGSRNIAGGGKAQQGTREYMESILQNMERNGQGDLVNKIKNADIGDDLKYIQVRQPISKTGELGKIAVNDFNF